MDVCDFVWQYKYRKTWHNFPNEEMLLLNESVKNGEKCKTYFSKKKNKSITVDFCRMKVIHDATRYEQLIQCLVGDDRECGIWNKKDAKEEWVCYNPHLSFILEIASLLKMPKLSLLEFEINLETMTETNLRTGETISIIREIPKLADTDEVLAIKQKNKFIFEAAVSKSNISRYIKDIESLYQEIQDVPTKKKRKYNGKKDDEDAAIAPNDKLEIKNNSNVLKSLSTNSLSDVPVDKECPIIDDYFVFSENTPFSATLNQTNLQNNNNKFYFIQLLKHKEKNQYSVWRRWGRVGQRGQTNLNNYGTNLAEAKDEFEKKFYDKTKNHWNEADSFVHVKGKYDLLQINLNPKAKPMKTDVQSNLAVELKALMELICDTQRMEEIMKEMSYDCNKTPLGELTLQQVKSGYVALNKITTILKRGGSHSELLNACNDFYTKIPHNFGMKTPPILRTQEDLDSKQRMLEALSNIQVAMDVMSSKTISLEHPLDKYYKSLNCSLELLEPGNPEYIAIDKCLKDTHGPTHSSYQMEIVNVFKCFKSGEESSFVDFDNKMILWHGSRIINWLGILKQGLRIAPPEAPRTGYMFGKGIYFADVSSKSANYCYATKRKNEGLLLMCEVSVGKQWRLLEADEELPENLPSNYNSVFGAGKVSPTDFQPGVLSSEAKVPIGPLVENLNHEGSLHYNEYIVYNTKQVKMKYLIRIKFNFK